MAAADREAILEKWLINNMYYLFMHVVFKTCKTNIILEQNIGPVSYTHLDVYKRQTVNQPKIFVAC